MNINKLFELTFDLARYIQEFEHNGIKMDGRLIWKEIEKNVTEDSIGYLKYNESLNEIYTKMDALIEEHSIEEGDDNPILNHFFLQLKNLVVKKSNFSVKVNRVLQLAFNAGQLKTLIELDIAPEYIKEFFEDNNMGELKTYLDEDKIDEINEYLKSLQEGGYIKETDNLNKLDLYLKIVYKK